MPGGLERVHFEQPLFPAEHLNANRDALERLILAPNLLAAGLRLSFEDAEQTDFSVEREDADSAAQAYNAVVADGRYIREFSSDPTGVAAKLGITLTAGAAAAITTAGDFRGSRIPGGPESHPVTLVAVAIIVIYLKRDPVGDVVIDPRGTLRL